MVLGWTQAFASVGGLFVTGVSVAIGSMIVAVNFKNMAKEESWLRTQESKLRERAVESRIQAEDARQDAETNLQEAQRQKKIAEGNLQEAQRQKEREELEAGLLAGLQSPTSEMTADDWTALRERILNRSPELRDGG